MISASVFHVIILQSIPSKVELQQSPAAVSAGLYRSDIF